MSGLALQKNSEVHFASPVLKWAGGKGMLLPQISKKFPNKLHYSHDHLHLYHVFVLYVYMYILFL